MSNLILSSYKNHLRGMIYALLAVSLWATLGVSFKLTFSTLDSFIVAVYVGFFTTLILGINLLFQIKMQECSKIFKKQPGFFIVTGIIGFGIQQIFYLKGYQLLPASQVVVIFYLYPLLMLLLSGLCFKEPISKKSALINCLEFLGLYILIAQGKSLNIGMNLGTISSFSAALSWALFSVLIKHRKIDVDIGMFLFNLFGLLFLICMIPRFGFSYELTNTQFLGILYLAIFPGAIAFILWNRALRLTTTGICSNIALLTPILSVLLSVIFLHESILGVG
ncbi:MULTISPECIES: DMT family transporter [unclassified Calothrix]|uniref:DMT family transporter n=2 Tax=Calothrix TaxID=1186 RepID=UPI001A7E89BD|nr:DMT family transporter [Calothrix sp. FACHB-1219]